MITSGKNKGQPRKVGATISLLKELPAAKALYAVHGNSLFGEGEEEGTAEATLRSSPRMEGDKELGCSQSRCPHCCEPIT